jgi:hypothetical protein
MLHVIRIPGIVQFDTKHVRILGFYASDNIITHSLTPYCDRFCSFDKGQQQFQKDFAPKKIQKAENVKGKN